MQILSDTVIIKDLKSQMVGTFGKVFKALYNYYDNIKVFFLKRCGQKWINIWKVCFFPLN